MQIWVENGRGLPSVWNTIIEKQYRSIFDRYGLKILIEVNSQTALHFFRFQHDVVCISLTTLMHGYLTHLMSSHSKL